MILTIMELDEDIMVLKNVTKFHKILIKTNQLKRADVGRCDKWTDGGNT